jgi:hypothetical protein
MRVRSLRRTIESYKDTGLIEQRKLERTGSVCASKHEKPPTRKLFCVQGCEFNSWTNSQKLSHFSHSKIFFSLPLFSWILQVACQWDAPLSPFIIANPCRGPDRGGTPKTLQTTFLLLFVQKMMFFSRGRTRKLITYSDHFLIMSSTNFTSD